MYIVTVPQVTIYLDQPLADQVKAQKVPVSAVCQRALRAELEAIKARNLIDRGLPRATQPHRRAK